MSNENSSMFKTWVAGLPGHLATDRESCFIGGYKLGQQSDIAKELAEALESALKTAEFEKHPFRPWHYDAKTALAKYKEQP